MVVAVGGWGGGGGHHLNERVVFARASHCNELTILAKDGVALDTCFLGLLDDVIAQARIAGEEDCNEGDEESEAQAHDLRAAC